MCGLKKYIWEISPANLPVVRRNCTKCNEKSRYISTERFRVNSNKNSIDVWLIYQCEKCKTTWNMTIYKRINPYDIQKNEYEKFLSNDKELAREYAYNLCISNKNKGEVAFENFSYELLRKKIETYPANENELIIEIVCKYPIELRVDKLLRDSLKVSRAQIKDMYKKGIIFIKDDKKSLNSRIGDGLEIHLLKEAENIEVLEANCINS